MSRFLDALRSGRVLLMDGAMGTELQRAGLKPGECGELWNLTHPEKVRAIHQAFVDAGAEVLLTNTFQANPAALARHHLDDQLAVICQSAVDLARQAAGPDRWVVADVAPYSLEEEWQGLPKLVSALSAAAPDGFFIETCSNPNTLVRVLKSLYAELPNAFPVLVSFTYRRDRENEVRTIDGLPPRKMARWMEDYSIAALGVNCGSDMGMPQILETVEAYRENTHRRLFARPNAGTPKQVDDRWIYPHTPAYMASWLPELLEAGVSMIGGCCGTTPEHIAAFRPIIDEWNRKKT
ncbi:MAG TPA: homocysteine S-methyltransferase family protein [Gemmataceae bacterium]|nr:homocysteine S-methyltransferase family protein [Gemmataceae bacterium]